MAVLGIGPRAGGAKDLLACLHCQVVLHVEHCLLPGRGRGLRAVQKPVLLWQQVNSMLKSATRACM